MNGMRYWKTGRRTLAALALMMLVVSGCALADGMDNWVQSEFNGLVKLASYAAAYDEWTDASGLGGVTIADQSAVRVISRNASVWAQPRTNSTKLGTVKNGEDLTGILLEGDAAGTLLEQDGFYAVRYNGSVGWINKAYTVAAPLEIVLMESNVPAYCAPDPSSKRVGSLSKLTRYTVLGFYDEFYVVSLREAAAYIPMSAAHYDSWFERMYYAGMSGTVTISTKTALRTGPGGSYAKVRDVKAGQTFMCLDQIDGWYLLADAEDGGYTYVWSGDAQVSW